LLDTINRVMAAVYGPALAKVLNSHRREGKAACKDPAVTQVRFSPRFVVFMLVLLYPFLIMLFSNCAFSLSIIGKASGKLLVT
jgi:hypothetical protein